MCEAIKAFFGEFQELVLESWWTEKGIENAKKYLALAKAFHAWNNKNATPRAAQIVRESSDAH
jgi:hypothetical protein